MCRVSRNSVSINHLKPYGLVQAYTRFVPPLLQISFSLPKRPHRLWGPHNLLFLLGVKFTHFQSNAGGARWRGGVVVKALPYKPAGRGFHFGVNGIFQWHNHSGRTIALGSTQPLTDISTRRISWGKRRPVHKADLTTILCRCHEIREP